MIETNRSTLHAIYTTDNSLPRRAAMTHTHTVTQDSNNQLPISCEDFFYSTVTIMIKQPDASNDSHRSIVHSSEAAILHIIAALVKYLMTMLCLTIKKMCSTYTVDIFSITAITNKKAFQVNTDHLQMGYTNMLSAPMTLTLTQ